MDQVDFLWNWPLNECQNHYIMMLFKVKSVVVVCSIFTSSLVYTLKNYRLKKNHHITNCFQLISFLLQLKTNWWNQIKYSQTLYMIYLSFHCTKTSNSFTVVLGTSFPLCFSWGAYCVITFVVEISSVICCGNCTGVFWETYSSN